MSMWVGFEMLIPIVVSALLTFGNGFVRAIHNTTKPFFPRSTVHSFIISSSVISILQSPILYLH
jgi:hypothetical protein